MIESRTVKLDGFSLEVTEHEDGSFSHCSIDFCAIAAFMDCSEDEFLFFSYDKGLAKRRFMKEDLDEVMVHLPQPLGYVFRLVRGENREFKLIPTRFAPNELLRAMHPDPYQRAVVRLESWMYYYGNQFFIGPKTQTLYDVSGDYVHSLVHIYDSKCYDDAVWSLMQEDGFDMNFKPEWWEQRPTSISIKAIENVEYERINSLFDLSRFTLNSSVNKFLHQILTDEEVNALIEHK